ncbi:MAG: hypothetical protein QF664_07200 [Dehalococcoidia bacterium]|jgi:hypothetical protein|nr:hypothetical protein [Dehalococcoidia bacterium]
MIIAGAAQRAPFPPGVKPRKRGGSPSSVFDHDADVVLVNWMAGAEIGTIALALERCHRLRGAWG